MAAVNYNTTHARPVATNPYSAAVSDDIGTECNGSRDVAAHARGVVDDKGNASIMGDFGDSSVVGKIVLGVRNRLDVYCSSLVIDCPRDF